MTKFRITRIITRKEQAIVEAKDEATALKVFRDAYLDQFDESASTNKTEYVSENIDELIKKANAEAKKQAKVAK